MKTILLGTCNKAKLTFMNDLLSDYNVRFVTPKDLGVNGTIIESGKTAVENALIKATQYYELSKMPTLATDNAMLFLDFPIDDPRQPHTRIRRMVNEKEMTDQEMINYYSSMAHDNGGKLCAYYETSYAIIDENGKSHTFENPYEKDVKCIEIMSFYLVEKPHKKYVNGLPLNTISVNRHLHKYFYDITDEDHTDEIDAKKQEIFKNGKELLIKFVVQSLKLEKTFSFT